MKKILFQNRPRHLYSGGDYIQLDNTVETLRKLGYEIDISEEYIVSPETIQKYDLVHLWNFPTSWTKLQLWVARKYKKPVICSMIYGETEEYVPYYLQQIMADELSYAIFQTEGEVERAKRHLTIKDEQIAIIPNGINPWWLEVSQSRLPIEKFVLTVGRIEPNKGQLEVAKVCKDLGFTYICIGEVMDKEYAKKIRDLGTEIKPFMPKEELKPWYFSAQVYIQPSKAETWSLCADEAVSQGTSVILTDMCERDVPFIRCKHGDNASIRKAILECWDLPKSFSFAEKLETWDNIGITISKLYESI